MGEARRSFWRIALPVGGVVVLCGVVWAAVAVTQAQQTRTVAEHSAAVTAQLDAIEATVPAASALDRTDEVIVQPCPLEGRGEQTVHRRSVELDPGFDRVAWAASLGDAFPEEEGWQRRVKPLDNREDLGIRLVGRELITVEITATGDDERARLTMRATSECASAEDDDATR
ncbi:hypothetical protein ROT00_01230 [Agromyces mediolanus]|uniref:hypothetical protein n=1 Tax=Agromyces mediolanus TaxID=41986 RepID=UPI0038399D1A